ncbi:MAG: DUF5722 domain-containing protein [Verrucomicrobiales bacterium]|nr:DUF5722 domain-containing protein [Verrucomicrobiales bacterium]
MKKIFILFSLLTSWAGAELPLHQGPFSKIEVTRPAAGVVDLSISGVNPHFWSQPVPAGFDPGKQSILAFEYFSPSGIEAFSIRYRQPDSEIIHVTSAPVPLAETWQPIAFDLSASKPPLMKPGEDSRFHFSLKGKLNEGLQIRKMVLRVPNADEEEAIEEREQKALEKEADAAAYLSYLRADYAGKIHRVAIGADKIVIEGEHADPANLRELRPPHASHAQGFPEGIIERGLSGVFRVELNRYAGPDRRDRAFSRFRLETEAGEIASLCRWGEYAAGVAPLNDVLKSPHQKGLGGIPYIGSEDHEIFELGISHATINVVLSALLSPKPRPGLEKIMFEGRPYYLNRRFLQQRETTVRLLRKKGVIVTAILLVGNHGDSLFAHPEAESRGVYAMPNLMQEAGSDLYRAALQVLGNHFREPGKRISNWVVHNEVDQAGTWTNMGDQPLPRYLETYHRSARMIYQTMRMRDPHARVFISLTHHWAKRSLGVGAYTVREMLELYAEMGRAEGDYEWGVAYHPYPQGLRNPMAWNDDETLETFDTPYITPKNFQVLPAFLAQDRFLYEGKPRGILFSEQGFNSPTLSIEDQTLQMAGLVELFRRLSGYPVIEAYHLHRYQDMPDNEGGLRLGIIDENGNRKLAWHAYEAIGTEAVIPFEVMADHVIGATSK